MYKNQNYQTGEKNIPYLFFDDDIIKNYHEWVNNALNTIKMKNEVFDGEYAYEINIPVKGFKKEQLLTFCGFRKNHPHDKYSIIRLGFKEKKQIIDIYSIIRDACNDIIEVYDKIKSQLL